MPVADFRDRQRVQALVSVRSLEEARLVAREGVPMIDLKEPRAGALGALPPATLRQIVRGLRADGCKAEISATIGDMPLASVQAAIRQVAVTAGCGVDAVKVGVWPGSSALQLLAELSLWAPELRVRVVPVFMADKGIDTALVAAACEDRFEAMMVDTQNKSAGGVFAAVTFTALRDFVATARANGRHVGLAGSLRLEDVPRVLELMPSFAGFRSAVCQGQRDGVISAERVRGVLHALRGPVPVRMGMGRA